MPRVTTARGTCAGALGGWTPLGQEGIYEFTRFDLVRHDYQPQGNCNTGRREASSTEPFGLWVWGWWGPDVVWEDPDETGLRALHILSHLRVAIDVTANSQFRARYQSAYEDLIKTHKYHWLTRNQKVIIPGSVNHSDDELAFMSYYPLLMYEKDPALLEVYRQSLERSWQIERPERNPLWNFI